MKNKKSIFIFFLSLMWHLKVFQLSLQRMYHMAEAHAQYIYIYICVYKLIVGRNGQSKVLRTNKGLIDRPRYNIFL